MRRAIDIINACGEETNSFTLAFASEEMPPPEGEGGLPDPGTLVFGTAVKLVRSVSGKPVRFSSVEYVGLTEASDAIAPWNQNSSHEGGPTRALYRCAAIGGRI